MRRSTALLGTTAAAMALAFGAGPAHAQEDGVTIDTDSPAAKEYALPHEEARREAS